MRASESRQQEQALLDEQSPGTRLLKRGVFEAPETLEAAAKSTSINGEGFQQCILLHDSIPLAGRLASHRLPCGILFPQHLL